LRKLCLYGRAKLKFSPRAKRGHETTLEKLTEQIAGNPTGLADRIEDQLAHHISEAHRENQERLQKMAEKSEAKRRPRGAVSARAQPSPLPQGDPSLIIDQAEELFHGDRNEADVEAFVTALARIYASGKSSTLPHM
jgi:Rod binding domain-containing protein